MAGAGSSGTIALDLGAAGAVVAATVRRALGPAAGELLVLAETDPSLGRCTALVTDEADRVRLDQLLTPAVRWIHVFGTGVDHFPLHLVGDRVLTCSRGASSVAIAEFVMTAMLGVEKRLPDIWIRSDQDWRDHAMGGLAGRTLGLIGVGAIGTAIAKRALSFEMAVIGHRRTAAPSPLDGLEITSMAEVLARADHLVLTAPATRSTARLLDTEALHSVKPGVHVVNVARGSLIDQPALLAALDRGQVGFASLDVADPEPLPAGHAFYRHPRIHLTPHVSWHSPQTMQNIVGLITENVRRYRSEAPLVGVVDVIAGY